MNKKFKKMELLSPVGGPEQLRAAINFGADAVYLAIDKFGMRAKATNFRMEEVADAVKYAHENNVKVYVTCNILMHERDINNLQKYYENLADAYIDALIISDMGAFSVAKTVVPHIDIHLSTQASVANSQAAIEWAKLGAKRIVLAREMSLEEIKEMRIALDAEGYNDTPGNANALSLEAFVHGAMCMSVSGRCLISSYLTNRSANKGLCTQPCRWGYNLEEENRPGQRFNIDEDEYGTYIMNSKDMNMLSHLDKLAEAGIASLKIEGRNKKALYVATVTNAYRHALDALQNFEEDNNDEFYINKEKFEKAAKIWEPELLNVSHRPYSTGFYFGQAEQSCDYDGYEQNCVHVADVLSCEKCELSNSLEDKNNYLVKILCRNRFEEGESLEALIPNSDILEVKVKDLQILNEEKNSAKSTDIANRTKEIYSFISTKPIKPGSFLRSKTFLRTSRENV